MAVERTYYCEGPTCDVPRDAPVKDEERLPAKGTTATPPPHLPISFIETRERLNGEDELHHFCSWDCVMQFAAKQPVAEMIPWDAIGGEDD